MKEKFTEYCNDDIKCRCRENTSKKPEWEHQVKWAILDLKYKGMLTFEKESKVYTIKKK